MHLSAEVSTVRIEKKKKKKSNPCSDARLSVEKSAEVIVPQKREGPNSNSSFLK